MRKVSILVMLLTAATMCGYAQNNHPDSLASQIKALTGEVSGLKKIKLSGMVQAQWQMADTLGVRTYAGGNFDPNTDNRFMVRRGRLKMTYSSKPVTAALQIDATEKGVSLKDAYGEVSLPEPLDNFSLKAGMFKRPFGFEVPYSSELRESPERARAIQTLLPNERDLGATLAFKLGFIKLEAGLFNGNTTVDFDSKKDFIGRISGSKEAGILKIGAGVSYYNGGVRQGTNRVFEFENGGYVLQDTLTAPGAQTDRKYFGADVQLNISSGIGTTTLRGEFVTGTQPGSVSSSESPKTSTLPNQDTYIRSFNAAVFYFIQNIGETGLQAVVKYDFYDPNSDASGGDISTEADVRYSTFGFGLNYYWKNLTFMAYYDKVENESAAGISKLRSDLTDNVLTLRMQFRF